MIVPAGGNRGIRVAAANSRMMGALHMTRQGKTIGYRASVVQQGCTPGRNSRFRDFAHGFACEHRSYGPHQAGA